jgi:hypothetical protein
MVFRNVIVAATLFGGTMLPASAMPVDNLAGVATSDLEQVRVVRGGYRGVWRRGVRAHGPGVYFRRGYGAYGRVLSYGQVYGDAGW